VSFDEGLGLTHEIDGQLLSNEFLEVITRDPCVGFRKNIPCWKDNLMRKMMEKVSRSEIGHKYFINWNNN